VELDRSRALDEEREQGHDRDQNRRLVERRLVNDEVVAVVQTGCLGDQEVERKNRKRPGRERRVGYIGHQNHRADHRHEVGCGQRDAADQLAAPRALRKHELVRRGPRAGLGRLFRQSHRRTRHLPATLSRPES
jgi:hypothetical protein